MQCKYLVLLCSSEKLIFTILVHLMWEHMISSFKEVIPCSCNFLRMSNFLASTVGILSLTSAVFESRLENFWACTPNSSGFGLDEDTVPSSY